MRNMRPQKQLLQFVMLSLFALAAVLVTSGESFAALQCWNCHGNNSNDAIPLDTPYGSPAMYRNITTGAVKGNHQTHLNGLNVSATNQDVCARCHNNSAYTSSHRSGTITLKIGMNFSTLGTYTTASTRQRVGTSYVFKNQTSVPVLGTCSTVNCHFESVTPTWGTDPATVTCDTCHVYNRTTGTHTAHLAVGSHAPYTCDTCHAPRPNFQHATSAGNVGRNIDLKGTEMAVATYAGSNFRYLPSQSVGRTFGTCSATYCHSTGQGNGGSASSYTFTGQVTPQWGNAATGQCSTCHPTNLLTTGSHSKHIANDINCGNCHTGATSATMNSTTHVDRLINVDGSQAVNYSQGTSSARGNGYGTCSNATCHSPTTATAPVTPTWGALTGVTCASCHAVIPTTGSHSKHVSTTLYNPATCGDCHSGASQNVSGGDFHFDGNVNVVSGLGYNTVIAKHAVGNYSTGGSCSTAYCHSSGQSANGLSITPVYGTAVTWGSTVACGSCHATTNLNTGSHSAHFVAVGTNCGSCHTNASATAYNNTTHVNAQIDVAAGVGYNAAGARGNGYGTCSTASCHTNGRGTAVLTPTWGVAAAACTACHALVPTTGSHTRHLQAIHPTVNCASCHSGYVQGSTAPTTTHLDGNIDVTVGSYPANKTINTAFASCSNVSCHNAPGATPAFTAPALTWGTEYNCAGCHGYPPANSNHTGVVAGTCNSCHSSVAPGGTVNTSTFLLPALHMNGTIDGGNCNSCHGYPPVQSMVGNGTNASYSSARMQNYSGGGGVHAVAGHLPKNLKVSQNLSFSPCLTCHPQGTTHNEGFGAFSTHHVQVIVDAKFKFDKNRPIVYNGVRSVGSTKTSGTCTNVECHFQKSPLWSTQTYTKGH